VVQTLLYGQQVAAPRGQVDEQPVVSELVTVPVEDAVVE
jgi:hypothetical protein